MIICYHITLVFSGYSTNKSDSHDIAEILLKVALNTITLTQTRQFLIKIAEKLESFHLISRYTFILLCYIMIILRDGCASFSLVIHIWPEADPVFSIYPHWFFFFSNYNTLFQKQYMIHYTQYIIIAEHDINLGITIFFQPHTNTFQDC